MKNFGKILKFEIKDFLRDKVFVGITIFLVVAIAIVMFIPNIISAVSGGNDDANSERPIMLVHAEDAALAGLIKEYFTSVFADYDVKIAEGSDESIEEAITSGEAECAFVMDGASSYTYYVNNLGMYDANASIASSVLQEVYRANAMMQSGLTLEQVEAIMSVQITSNTVTLGKDQMQTFFYTYPMIMALYMIISLYGQMVSVKVATEKSSRAMELLITSTKPVGMMFGKITASCLAGLTQLVAIFGSALLFYRINESAWEGNSMIQSIFNIPVDLFAYMLVFFVLGFLIYAFLFGAIGSTVSKIEEVSTTVTPITMISIVSFIIVIFSASGGGVDSVLMKVCSYIPFSAPMAMFARICMGSVAWYEIAASIAILIGSTVGIGVIAAKIYRMGVLMYGNTPKLSTILKALRKA